VQAFLEVDERLDLTGHGHDDVAAQIALGQRELLGDRATEMPVRQLDVVEGRHCGFGIEQRQSAAGARVGQGQYFPSGIPDLEEFLVLLGAELRHVLGDALGAGILHGIGCERSHVGDEGVVVTSVELVAHQDVEDEEPHGERHDDRRREAQEQPPVQRRGQSPSPRHSRNPGASR
jgi:hypothetical protein